ncbi:MAG: glycerophosphodiester phosphodiesterase [Verrucomicrobia bacterium]|nr:glycerophosphodiester phosphodiesterase [Verrucomicrobiota bacterium]
MKAQKLFCFGHRGARGHEPENTLRSVRKGLELGADGIEVDVYFVDGELIVIHDRTLGRTTNGSGFVSNKSFAYLRSLDAGKGEKIPTLAEVFDTVNRRAIINVELKGPRTAAPVVKLIDDYVAQRGWRYDDFLLSAFDHKQIVEAKRLRPEIPTGALMERVPRSLAAFAVKLGASSVNPPKERVTAKLVADAHRRGLKVFAFTVNEPADIARMRALGVDGVFSDYPERCR